MARVYNFNPGPAVLPESVLREVQEELLDFRGSGMSILESSHRGKEYAAIHTEAATNIAKLLGLSTDYKVLFLTGGASQQFAMVPMNLLGPGQVADYVKTGEWSAKAIKEAQIIGQVNVIADTSASQPARMPALSDLKQTPNAAYFHITSNETVAGTQWQEFPKSTTPLISDMSSDILSRPINANDFALIYAGAQKNLGPAGVTIVIIRQDLIERANSKLPTILRYNTHSDNDSLYNTPPCFAIYVLALMTRWLLAQGGVAGIAKINRQKAETLYAAIDGAAGFYRGTAAKEYRSQMNITFRLPSEDLEARFLQEAAKLGFKGLKGHRSVGGIRASIYNAFPLQGVEALVAFMKDFAHRQG